MPMLFILSLLSLVTGTRDVADVERWSYDGHRIVCEIAWQNLSSETKSAIREFLAGDSDYNRFSESCVWADVIRREPGYERFITGHYVNLPRGAARVNVNRDCASLCVVQAIKEQKRILADETATQTVRLEALKFVAHFVGDIHQPLHVAYGDDRGGNSSEVTYQGEDSNLHRVWDGSLIREAGVDWPLYADELGADISAVDRILWESSMVEDWANESFQITESFVYEYDPDAELSEEYYVKNKRTVEQQLKKAGIRLAALLNEVLH